MTDTASTPSAQQVQSHRLWLRQFDPVLDFPATRPITLFMVCSTRRSGGHYFCDTLHGTRALGYPLEYLNLGNFEQWRTRLDEEDDCRAYAHIKSIRTSQNGVFGIKVHYAHLAKLHAVDERAYAYKAIQLIRRDN